MSDDWFEEAISELDDVELDDIDGDDTDDISLADLDGDEDDISLADLDGDEDDISLVDLEAGESAEPAETDDTVDNAEREAEISQVDSDSDIDTKADVSRAETSAETEEEETEKETKKEPDDATDTTTAGADPFGFGGDDSANDDSANDDSANDDSANDDSAAVDDADGADTTVESASSSSFSSSTTEFDADTGGTDEFGFDTGTTADSVTDDPTTADSTDDESSTQAESSMAQSADEFGFSLDEMDDTPSPEPSTASQRDPSSTEPTAAPPDDSPEPGADQSDGGDDPFGFGNSGSGSTAATEGGDDEFGFGGFGGGGGGETPSPSGPEEFDDEEFESEIDRIDLGIDGLDDMILGGVPERSLIGIIGGAGTGKTTFALQFLNKALTQGERAVFITLEQTEEAVLSTAEEKGWPFRQYVEDDMLAIVVLDPVEMANSLASIRGDISRLIREFGASRLVLDSVSLLEMMYDHPAKRRSEVFDFTRSLKNAGVTTLLTSEASEDSSHASRYGAVEYLTDAVFVLRYVRTSNFEETRMAIEIQKIRDANHSRATKPYDLTDEGMSVHKQANIF